MSGQSSGKGLLSRIFNALSFGGGSSAVGLSVGTHSVKIVELKKKGRGWKLVHFAVQRIRPDSIVNGEILNAGAVVEAIKALLQQSSKSYKNVCLGISGNFLIVKRLNLEVKNMRELQDQIFWEAEQYIPYDATDVVMDYHVLSKSKDKRVDVILVAIKKSVLDTYTDTVEAAGLNARVVDIDYFALQNVFEANYPVTETEAVGMIDVGASSMKLVVLQGGIPVFTRDMGMGAGQLIHDLERVLNISASDAEALLESAGRGAWPREAQEVVRAVSDTLATEIKKAIEYYQASSTGASVSYLMLGGGGSKIIEFAKAVEEKVGIPTQMLNPFNGLSYDESKFSPETIASIAPFAVVPVGLAIRGGSP